MYPHTLDDLKKMQQQALDDLVAYVGGPTHLAKMLDRPLPTINGWIKRGRISKAGANDVQNHPTLRRRFPISNFRPELID